MMLRKLLTRVERDDGFTMIAVVGAIALVTTLAAVALAAARGDIGLVKRDLDEKRSFAAAQAGLGDYSFHLNNDNGYWARCTNVPAPHAVNQAGSTANRRFVPGSNDAQYSLELIPRTGQASCSTTNPVGTMLEQGGPSTGTFRVRSTGYVGDTSQSIVATMKRASFLDYIYFTQLETSDPVTYGNATTIAAANTQCSKYRREGRQNVILPNNDGQPCDVIRFVTGDHINGPLHTNDALVVCGNPVFGRGPADPIEVGDPPPGWYPAQGCAGSQPTFVGPPVTSAPVLTPPATNGKLRTIAGASYTYTCQTNIVLNGNTMAINGGAPVAFPASGVVYVANGNCPNAPSCASGYSPFTVTYPASSDCGTVRVSGTYSGRLTIAAENDIVIWDDVIRSASSNGMLGLIANNFVRVRHPICPSNNTGCTTTTAQTGRGDCNSGVNGSGSQSNLRIDAAILAINHSFIVDHYDCGNPLNTLTVNGAISQKFRGAVGTGTPTSVSHGYLKNYNYDDRLRAQDPPNFLDPVQSAWRIQRETLDSP